MTNYLVFITPLKSRGVYDAEIEITDWVVSDNIGEITRAIDSTDYDVGIYTINDVTLVVDGSDGYLGAPGDTRSLFSYSRDLAKVRIVFLKDGVPNSTFLGLVNEEGTTVDGDGQISLTVMGHESVLKKEIIPAGTVQDGFTFQEAYIAILVSAAGGVLNVNADNISPVYNGTVDVGSWFDNKSAQEGLDALLLPSNSILLVDSEDNVYVKSRLETDADPLYLYGKGDLLDRENILAVGTYNSGLQRTFNLIRVKGGQASATVSGTAVSTPALTGVAQDGTSMQLFGLRPKDLTVEFVTEQTTLDAIAAALLAEFAYPKAEIEVTVATELLQAATPVMDLLRQVSFNVPLVYRPMPNCRLPFEGIAIEGDPTTPVPFDEGALVIPFTTAWKVIELRENPQDFTSALKLRVKGSGLNDGTFNWLTADDGTLLLSEDGRYMTA